MARIFTILSVCTTILIISFNASSQTLSNEQLAREGARIGRAYYMAQRNNDIDLLNDALDQFNDVLMTLRKQEQVDILTNAFNRVNIPISDPLTDARRYSHAFINALISGDSIAIEDATDIVATVKEIYKTERDSTQVRRFASLYDANAKSAMLGLEVKSVSDSVTSASISSDAHSLSQSFLPDTMAVKMILETFHYYQHSDNGR